MSFLFGKVTPRGAERGMFGRFGPIVGGLLSIVLSPFWLIIRGFPFVLHLIGGWWGKREFKYLLYGLPTIVVGVTAAWFLINGKVSGGTAQRALLYQKAAQLAFKRQAWDQARLYYQRAVEMGISDPAVRFELAQAAEKSGDDAVKVAVMDSLAPETQPGFVPAHLWKAAVLLQGRTTPAAIELAMTHLNHVVTLNPTNAVANTFLGEIYFQTNRMELSRRHFLKVATLQPKHQMMLAKACGLTGDVSQAATWAERAMAHYREALLQDETDMDARLALSDACFFREDFQQAVDVLRRGLEIDPADSRLRSGLARVYVHLSDSIQQTSRAANQRKFELLSAALIADPNELSVFDRLTAHLSTDKDVSAEGTAMLLDNIAQGRAVAMSHLILGTIADRGSEDARFHLERAYEELPTAGIIINNLAWSLAHAENPDLNRALELMNALIDRASENPDLRYLDTRGTIFLKLERWKEAIRDLEAGLPAHRNSSATHQALSEAYQQLGSGELAERHRELAGQLQESPEN
ncbi:MAG: tetratricopeptide repeat protein [Planctomycetaceae bacterium]